MESKTRMLHKNEITKMKAFLFIRGKYAKKYKLVERKEKKNVYIYIFISLCIHQYTEV